MTALYSIRKTAQEDLENIWYYTFEEWGKEQADRYLNSLFNRFTLLAENPAIGKKRDDIKPGYHCFPEGKHLVFYTVSEKGIDIIGLPHQSMDVIIYIR